jgi:phosphoserine phosphatase
MRAGKVARLHHWLQGRDQRFEQFQSTAYSDSINDLPLLEAVQQPVAVNADARLAALAEQRGWRCLSLYPVPTA